MRAGRLKTRRYKTHRRGRGGLLLLLMVGAACLAGTWLLREGEISFLAAPAPTLTPAESAPDTRTLTLPGKTWYTLQLGVFESREAAEALGASYQSRGAAGYVLPQEAYHVLAAAYQTRSDAQAVQSNLRTLHGVDAYVYEISRPEITLRLSGQHAQLTALSDAYDALDQLADQLYTLSRQLDNREAAGADVIAALQSHRETLENLSTRIKTLFGPAPHAAVAQVTSLLDELAARLAAAAQASGETRLGGQVKYCQLQCLAGMARYAESLAK